MSLLRRFVMLAVVLTIATASTAFAKDFTVTNSAGIPINVQIGVKSVNLQPGGVARVSINTSRPPVACFQSIGASGTIGRLRVWANPVQINACGASRTSFAVSRSGSTLRIQ